MILSPLKHDHQFELPTLASLNVVDNHCPAHIDTTKLRLAFYSYNQTEFNKAYDALVHDISCNVSINAKQKTILVDQGNRIKKTAALYFSSCNNQTCRKDVKTTDLYSILDEKGSAPIKLDRSIHNQIIQSVAKEIDQLTSQKDRKTSPKKHDSYDRVKIIDRSTKTWQLVEKAFKTCGVYEGVSKYNRSERDLQLHTLALHYSKPSDTHHTQTLADLHRDVLTKSFHMDPKWNVMKAILYLCDVDQTNGPFTVIPGSNRWHYNEFERVVAAGNSVGNYLSSPDHRYVMSCFPPEMTKNVIMGNYFDDGSPMSNLLLSQMHQYTSDEADVILFDPAHTIHRGGLCDTSDRVNLQIIMR